MSKPSDYGKLYWCVICPSERIHLFADEAKILPDGTLALMQGKSILFAFAPGQWKSVYAASCLDGGAVAVEH